MPILWISIAVWLLLLAVLGLYVRRIRHPSQEPLAAYLIFVTVFTVASFGMFVLVGYAVGAAGWTDALERPVPALLFLAAVFLPAFLIARWQTRKPPRRPPPI